MYTLSIVLNKDMNAVLVCTNRKMGIMNFVGGKVESMEDYMTASYRELEEETGITKDDIELKFLQTETCTMADNSVWSLYITYGVLNKDVELKPEKNPLTWIYDFDFLRACGFDGDCAVFMNRVLRFIRET